MVLTTPQDEQGNSTEDQNPIHEMGSDGKPGPDSGLPSVGRPPADRPAGVLERGSGAVRSHPCPVVLRHSRTDLRFRTLVNQLDVAVAAAGKSRAVFGSASRA